MSGIATIYIDRDNSFTMTLKKNDINLTENEMNAITKFEIKYLGKCYNSVDNAAAFVVTPASATVKVKPYVLDLGVSPKTGDWVEVILYDLVDYTHGIMWDQFSLINKIDAALC